MMFPDDEVTESQRRPRILAVEDDAAVLTMLKKLLSFADVITAEDGAPRDVIAGINAGARYYVTKPFKHAELLDKVLRALRT
jgi:DNA-binding response OmpR family regulator